MQHFTETEFDESRIPDIQAGLVDIAFDEGKKLIEEQIATMRHIWQNSNQIISWLIPVIIALAGIFLGKIMALSFDAVCIVSGYGAFVSLAATITLIIGVTFRRDFYLSGDSPSHFLREDVTCRISGLDDRDAVKYAKGWYLWELQYRIMQNEDRNNRSLKYYRIALLLLSCGFASGILLFIGLSLAC